MKDADARRGYKADTIGGLVRNAITKYSDISRRITKKNCFQI